jgi:uncharacterized integral membrane protein
MLGTGPGMTDNPLMIRKAVATLILVPLAVVIVLLAIANRHAVIVSFDPLSMDKPALTAALPLFLVLFLALLAGVIVGGTAAWLRQRKWRRAARRAESDARRLRGENEALKQRIEAAERMPQPRPVKAIAHRPPAA